MGDDRCFDWGSELVVLLFPPETFKRSFRRGQIQFLSKDWKGMEFHSNLEDK